MTLTPAPDAGSAVPVAQLVRALLERHAIPRHRHVSFVGEFFQLSRAAAHQRVTRSNAWTLEELRALALRFGESVSDVVDDPTDTAKAAGVAGTLKVGAMTLPCRVWLSEEAVGQPDDQLVAIQERKGYAVIPSTASLGQRCWRIAKLELLPSTAKAPRVAVHDVEREVSHRVCEQLRASGVEANAYPDLNVLLDDAAQGLHDGYVISWPGVGQPTVIALLKAVRRQSRRPALVLLTGGRGYDAKNVEMAAAAAVRFGAQLVEKPVQPALLMAALSTLGLKPPA